MKGIEIRKLDDKSTDGRGAVREWMLKNPAVQITVFERKKGEKSGKHYHKGKDKSKNPERFLLVSGKIRFRAINLDTEEQIEKIISSGTELIIEKGIYHDMEMLSDSVFIEARRTMFDSENPDKVMVDI